jgi:hypothetical protein
LDPKQIADLLPMTPNAASPSEDADVDKLPPVSAAALQAWFEAYRKAYPGDAQTNAHALASAKGMFPDKTVSRDAVRALFGAKKTGPKSKSAE